MLASGGANLALDRPNRLSTWVRAEKTHGDLLDLGGEGPREPIALSMFMKNSMILAFLGAHQRI